MNTCVIRQLALLHVLACLLQAEVRLPALFSDHAVLQAGKAVPVWGWASAGEDVAVSVAGQTKSTQAGKNGKWQVKLDAMKSAGPQEMVVKGTNTLTVRDVLIGEVWLCSGQSNMVMRVRECRDAEQEQKAASLPLIRMFTVIGGRAESAQEDCKGAWTVCTPETAGEFSAAAFYFGRGLHQRLGGAVGLINSSAGGTLIESWLNPEAQRACAALQPFFKQRERLMAEFDHTKADELHAAAMKKWEVAKAQSATPPKQPGHPYQSHLGVMDVGGLFNGMIAPLIPCAVRGIAWYQGESNATAERVPFYDTQMRLLVSDWRRRWGAELPFVWVQLPNVKKSAAYADLREAQRRCLDLPQTGMAITIDIGESRDLHPKNKQDVGRRLAQWALGTVYGVNVPATSGPLLASHDVRGSEIVLRFQHASGGLMAKGGPLQGFVIAGENRAWKPAEARIEGETVIVSSPSVAQPVAVRYAWAADPVCNLFNAAGLPASPFRTDAWPHVSP